MSNRTAVRISWMSAGWSAAFAINDAIEGRALAVLLFAVLCGANIYFALANERLDNSQRQWS